MADTFFRSRRVVLPTGTAPASIHVKNGRIAKIGDHEDVPAGAPLEDFGDLVLMPGLVDSHVHINEPGRTEWEGFETATRAAAAGGVTTIMDMPLNSIPPTTTLSGFDVKAQAADGKLAVDVMLAGGVVPGNAAELEALFARGAPAFKCFLAESGVDEFRHVLEDDLERALPILAKLNAPLLVHAELPGPLDAAAGALENLSFDQAREYSRYLASRPKTAEDAAVEMVIRLAEKHGARAHIVHLSSASAVTMVQKAHDRKVALTVETCPHYLSLAAEGIEDGQTAFKCAPPIREEANREALWKALENEVIAQVVTDHSPSTAVLKCIGSGDFSKAWGGIASLQLGLAVVWTEARERGGTPNEVARWMCEAPARLIGMQGRKGSLVVGADADFCVWDPDGELVVNVDELQHKNKVTPYDGKKAFGTVTATFLRGEKIYEKKNDRDVFAPRPTGRHLCSTT
ncbi:MAG TPA: allantoinase AllB [Polyangiaceae bacterium]